MMQAAARSYRLNQTHPHCKTVYMFYEDTMEATAMHLMSRKQRAAKLLNGDIGLTGLDALTEGEGGLEEALMDAIGKGESLIDPKELFKTAAAQSEISDEDAAYWNVEVVTAKTIQAQTAQPVVVPPQHDIFEYVNVEDEHASLQPPMLEPASAGVETHDALVKALENCGGQITNITNKY